MNRLPLDEEFAPEMIHSIGRLFIMSAVTENAITNQLFRLVMHPFQDSGYAALAFVGMDLKVKLKLIKDISFFKAEHQYEEIGKACDKLRRSFDHRNNLAHMTPNPKNPKELFLYSLRPGSDGLIEPPKRMTLNEINEHAEKTHVRLLHLDDLLNKAGIEPLESIQRRLGGPTQ